jgi:hypothetical protein
MTAMRRTSSPLLVGLFGLTLAFAVNCGSVTGDGTGTGGSGGSGTGGSGSGGSGTGGSGTGGDHATGGSGGHATGGGAGAGTGGSGTGGSGGHATGGSGGHATGGGGGSATGGAGGGSTGTGGHAGATGSGGAAGGGGGHPGGGAGGSGESCTQLSADYAAAFPAAEACTPGAANQCQTLMPTSLACGCSHYVNDATKLKAIQQQWTDQGCNNSTIVCPLIACIAPGTAGDCVAVDGAAPGGVCGSGLATPL